MTANQQLLVLNRVSNYSYIGKQKNKKVAIFPALQHKHTPVLHIQTSQVIDNQSINGHIHSTPQLCKYYFNLLLINIFNINFFIYLGCISTH